MKKSTLLLLFLAVQASLFAQRYFAEGTTWKEIRLDTQKYDSWYSQVGDEWVPNFETIVYSVKGKYNGKNGEVYHCVYTDGPDWTEKLALLLQEEGDAGYVGQQCVMASVLVDDFDGGSYALYPGLAYQFDWSTGKGLYYEYLVSVNAPSIERSRYYYGIIGEIKEGDFGGVRPLKYVDLDGKAPENEPGSNINNVDTQGGRIIQGIGIIEWNDGECLFGAPNPYAALAMYDSSHPELYPERHYRSMLVHFERGGEVLYDVWPEKGATTGIKSTSKVETSVPNTFYDLQGRRLTAKPIKGIVIQNGCKVMVK